MRDGEIEDDPISRIKRAREAPPGGGLLLKGKSVVWKSINRWYPQQRAYLKGLSL